MCLCIELYIRKHHGSHRLACHSPIILAVLHPLCSLMCCARIGRSLNAEVAAIAWVVFINFCVVDSLNPAKQLVTSPCGVSNRWNQGFGLICIFAVVCALAIIRVSSFLPSACAYL